MKKEIKDYLHLYLGCQVEVEFKDGAKGITKLMPAHVEGVYNNGMIPSLKIVKPVLRPLSDMTQEELQECGNLVYDFSDDDSGIDLNNHRPDDFFLTTSEQFHWLIQRHFDVFGLIESGLAIDKTKIK